jgi:hypothetical protein
MKAIIEVSVFMNSKVNPSRRIVNHIKGLAKAIVDYMMM